VQVAKLPAGARIEVEAVATRGRRAAATES